jgi:polysaccharide biosynthesis protein PslG
MQRGLNRLWVLVRLALLMGLLTLVRPPQALVTLGPQQRIATRNDLAGVHTRFTEEAEAWKIQRGLQMVREMGAPWVVEFFPWAYYEPSKGNFTWANADRIVDHANRQGLKIIARLGFVPEWARPPATTFTYLDPTHYADFANYAAAFAAHFKGRVQHIVIWNEPNLSGEWGLRPVDAKAYVEMLRAVYPAVKTANPDALVLAGALAPTLEPAGSPNGLNDLTYLEQMFEEIERLEIRDSSMPISNLQSPISSAISHPYDAWAIHTYGRTVPPGEAPAPDQLNFRRAELLREVMVKHGDADLPVFITESGWNDDPRWAFGVTPAQRIAYTVQAWDYAKANWPWAKCVAVWVFKLPASAQGYRDNFTFVTPSLEPLPIYDEVKRALVP